MAESLGYSAEFVAGPCVQSSVQRRYAEGVMMAGVLCMCISVALLVGGVTYLMHTLVA